MTLVAYQAIKIEENNDPLVDLSEFDFVLEPSYFKQGLARDKRIFLRREVAGKLMRTQKSLRIYKFKIWDGFRPRIVQNNIYQKFWKELKKQHPEWGAEQLGLEVGKFVTEARDPLRIPPHATGGAVDLTLVDLSGKEIDMGTEFDHFGPKAAPFYFDEQDDKKIAQNRRILREAMQKENFRFDKDEWWHYDYGNQLWALDLHRANAFYGEAPTPDL